MCTFGKNFFQFVTYGFWFVDRGIAMELMKLVLDVYKKIVVSTLWMGFLSKFDLPVLTPENSKKEGKEKGKREWLLQLPESRRWEWFK